MAIKTREIKYKTFGRVLAIENGAIELYVTLDVGPRVIRYALAGGENFMFEDVNLDIVEKGAGFDDYFYKGAYWHTYGGHRIWLTPESKPETYYPDNDPVAYRIEGNKFTFTPPPQKSNDVQETLILTVSENTSEVEVCATAEKLRYKTQIFGLWQVSVMCKNGLAVAPQTTRDTVLLPQPHDVALALLQYGRRARMLGPRADLPPAKPQCDQSVQNRHIERGAASSPTSPTARCLSNASRTTTVIRTLTTLQFRDVHQSPFPGA